MRRHLDIAMVSVLMVVGILAGVWPDMVTRSQSQATLPDTTGATAATLTPSAAWDGTTGSPSLVARPDGDKSAIFLVNPANDTQVKLAEEPFAILRLPMFERFVTLSPNRRYVTYVTADDLRMGNARLWLVDLASMNRRLLALFPREFWVGPLTWSPDGKRIAFTKVVKPSPDTSGIELWTIGTELGDQGLVTADPSFGPELFRISSLPVVRWSADATKITYTNFFVGNGLILECETDLDSGTVRCWKHPIAEQERSLIAPLATLPCEVTGFAQNSPEWRNDIMQTCGLTIGAAGCALTSTAMVLGYYGVENSPRSLNRCLGNSACPIYWATAASKCGSGKVSWKSSPAFGWGTLEAALNSGRPPILDMACPNSHHYVVVVAGSGSSPAGYTINDSWDGQVKSLTSYSSCSPAGLRLYSGTPWCEAAGPCLAPSLIEPANGAILDSRRITFRWNPLNGCAFNGYTFRVCTSDNLDDPTNCFIDTGEAGTQRTETITDRDFQDLYWGVLAANAPNGASWAKRHLRIEPTRSCNPNADQIALYVHDAYRGQCMVKGIGHYSDSGAIGLPDDSITSILVGANAQAIVCEKDDFGGVCESFTSDDSNLSDNSIGNDRVSSVQVERRIPSAPTNVRASAGDYCDKVRLTWDSSAGTTFYEVFRATSSSGAKTLLGSPTTTALDDTSAIPGTTHYYVVKACTSYGCSSDSDHGIGYRATRPSSVLDVQASDGTYEDKVHVDWHDATGASSYQVYRATAVDGIRTHVGSTSSTYFDDTSATTGTTYHYWVTACNSCGCSDFGFPDSGDRNDPPYTPSSPSPANGATDRGPEVVLTWAGGDPDAGDMVTYDVYLEGDHGPQSLVCDDVPAPECDPGRLAGETRYLWSVEATDNHGARSAAGIGEFTTGAGDGPLVYHGYSVDDDLEDESVGNGDGVANCGETIELFIDLHNEGIVAATGVSATLNTIDSYVVLPLHDSDSSYRNLDGGSTGTSNQGFDFSLDECAPDGHMVQFGLDVYASNMGPWHSFFEVPVRCSQTVLVEPNSVEASDGIDCDKVTVTWESVPGATRYELHRASSSSGTKSIVGTCTGSFLEDTSAAPGRTYYYWVRACTDCGCTDYGGADAGHRASVPPVPPGSVVASDGVYCDKVLVTWENVAQATSYEVWRATAEDVPRENVGTVFATSYEDATVVPGNSYYFWVRACSICGCTDTGGFDTGHQGSQPSAAPGNVQASDGLQGDKVMITWEHSPESTSYDVFRALSPEGSPIRLGSTAAPPFEDTTAEADTTHYYRVKACNQCGCSDYSTHDTGYHHNVPPLAPTNPSPADGAIDQSVHVNLGWLGGDSDPNDSVSYDVHLQADDGTPDELRCSSVRSAACDPGKLAAQTHFHWYVVATDNHGAVTVGNTWDFATRSQSELYLPLLVRRE